VEAHQVSAKLFVEAGRDGGGVAPMDFINAFHDWIRTSALDELLIDVTDYSHVHHGPGVLLLTHEGQYGMDEAQGRLGMLYLRKRDEPGALADKLRETLRRTFTAARLLEQELAGRIVFRGDELLVRVHSRLLAPNDAATRSAARAELDAVAAALYAGVPTQVEHEVDPKQLFAVRLKSSENPRVQTLLERLTPA